MVRADLALTAQPLGAGRELYQGTLEQIAEDVEAARQIGTDEVILSLSGDPGLDEVLDTYARIAETVGLQTSGSLRVPDPAPGC